MARYIGNYEVVKELGSGSYGAVYLAVGEVPGRGRVPGKRRIVAVKKLRDSADTESVDLLLQEFALLDQVKHRGVVRVFEYLPDENAVVMEHIHGVTLREVLDHLSKAREQVFTEAAIEIGCELADALYQAFTTPGDNGEPLQLVHRDLKPENLMLTPSGEVKILDFGLARVDNADFERERGDRIKGTPIYMAPEQAKGLAVDHRTDLFALGLILYELLMNRAAYQVNDKARDPYAEIMGRIEQGELGKECEELEGLLPGVGPIVTRGLQRRPKDRYQHGHDMLVDLRRQLYRDRGAYLEEFCEFFFGTIHDIGEAPRLDELKARGRAAGSSSSRRKSIEERLKESMAREKRAVRTAARVGSSASGPSTSPRPAAPSKTSPGRGAPPPAPSRPSGPPPPPAPRVAPMAGSGRKPPVLLSEAVPRLERVASRRPRVGRRSPSGSGAPTRRACSTWCPCRMTTMPTRWPVIPAPPSSSPSRPPRPIGARLRRRLLVAPWPPRLLRVAAWLRLRPWRGVVERLRPLRPQLGGP